LNGTMEMTTAMPKNKSVFQNSAFAIAGSPQT
jgi:hypothetical protein